MRGMIAIFSVSHFSWMSVCVCACIVYSHFGVIRSHFHGIHKGIYYRNYLVRLWVGGWLRVYALLLHLFKHKKFIIFSAEIFHVSRQQRVRISFTCSLALPIHLQISCVSYFRLFIFACSLLKYGNSFAPYWIDFNFNLPFEGKKEKIQQHLEVVTAY